MEHHRLYHELAHLWPILSPPEEYAVEAWHLKEILQEKLGPGRHSVLDMGCGGGHVLSHLSQWFNLTALDLSPEMLSLSQNLNPAVPHHLGDMREVRLGITFDAVLVHDAIDYMLTEDDLSAAFQSARMHLRPGGVLLLAPDHYRETFVGPSVLHWVHEKEGLTVTFIEHADDLNPSDTQTESVFFYIINDHGVRTIEEDHHTHGLFPKETWLRLLRECGFAPEERNYPPYAGGYGGNVLVGVVS